MILVWTDLLLHTVGTPSSLDLQCIYPHLMSGCISAQHIMFVQCYMNFQSVLA